MIAVFDGHNDLIQRLVAAGPRATELWLQGDGTGALDLPRMRAGGMVGGFFALWSPVEHFGDAAAPMRPEPPFAMPLPSMVSAADALPQIFAQAAALMALERSGTLSIVRSRSEIDAAIAAGRIAAVLHMEGAEAIADLDALHLWHAAGLRSLGPVWSRPTRYGHGVPFAFPSSPDTGDGLTDAGKALIRECNQLRIMVDLSHLNEKGMDDVAALSDAPLVATHSCVHAISPSSRNLTDRQLCQIADSGGVVGLNFASDFLRPDGRHDADLPLTLMLRHLDHLLGILGENGVALGSDFDGALMPAPLTDAAALPALIAAMRTHGYGETLIERIAARNWLDLLARCWGG